MKFETPKPDKEIAVTKKPEMVLVRPTKPMTMQEMQREIEEAGLRPATLEELQEIVASTNTPEIEPSQADIETEGIEVTEEAKRLPSKTTK